MEDIFEHVKHNLPVIRPFPWELIPVGEGGEGRVYQYKEYAVKDFNISNYRNIRMKLKKIEILSKENTPGFYFPKGIYESNNGFIKGSYMLMALSSLPLSSLRKIDLERFRESAIIFSQNTSKLHQNSIYIGDVKKDNILIDQNYNLSGIDTDNYMVKGIPFDVKGNAHTILTRTYNRKYSPEDTDIFNIAVVLLDTMYPELEINRRITPYFTKPRERRELLKELIKIVDVNPEARYILELILSDAPNKPYIHEFLNASKDDIIVPRSIKRL